MRRSLVIAGAAIFAGAAGGAPLHAQGSSLDQFSACMVGRVGAGIADPCDDGSAVFFSPAALATQGSAVMAGVTIVRSSNVFRYHGFASPPGVTTEREPEVIPVPFGFASYKVNPRLAAAIGVFAPYGLGLEWPVCPIDDPEDCGSNSFEGRFTGYDNSIRSIYIQPTVAYELIPGRLSVGAGVDVVRATIDVHRRIDVPQLGLTGRDVADVYLSGEGNSVTGHVGIQARLSDRTAISARYLHEADVEFEGDADFTRLGIDLPAATVAILDPQFAEGARLDDQAISTDVTFPTQWVVGISHRPLDRLLLLADYQRTMWSSFDQFDIAFAETGEVQPLILEYSDANTFRFGAEYDWSDALALRAGFRYNTAATPRATPFLPEGERNYYTVGVGYRVSRALSADLGFQYINQPDREGAVIPGGPNVGVYESSAGLLTFSLAYRFGGRGGN
jgi:long-chain fatty acid transport protein